MAVSSLAVPKAIIPKLVDLPRDIFNSVEGIAPGALPAFVSILMNETYGGVGLDITLVNSGAVAGSATVIFDNTKIVTLVPGARFNLGNVLFMKVQVQRAGAGAILVDAYFAGVSYDLMRALGYAS